jgi:hypothetical protein
VRDRTPTVIELQALYIRRRVASTEDKPEVILLSLQLLDVTLHFGSNVAYDFTAITTIFLLINIAGYNEYLEHDPLRSSLLHCKYKFEEMLRSSWFPQNKSVVAFFNEPEEFASKLATHPFTVYFPGYTDDNDREAILAFLSLHFKNLRPKQFVLGVDMRGIQSFSGDSIIQKLLLFSEIMVSVQLNVARVLDEQERGC